MATASERLKFIIEGDSKSAVKAFSDAEKAADKSLGGTEAKLDKLGAGLTKFGAGAMAFAGVAGAGLIKLGADASAAAIEAGKFSDATGLSVEAASRWIEVAGDIGIEAGTVEKSLGFMNKTLGNSPEKFAALGVEVVKAKDGTTDANATFLAVVDRLNAIKDPAAKAAAGAQLLGKGWQGMAELIATGSGSLTKSLAAVSDAKVTTPEELAKAKEFRAAIDQMKDSFQDLAISIGQGVAPVIATVAKGLSTVVDVFGKLDSVTSGAAGTFMGIGTAVIGAAGALSFISGKLITGRERFQKLFTTVDADGVRSMNKFGKGMAVAGGIVAAATTVIALHQMAMESDARAAENSVKALEDFARATDLGDLAQSFENWRINVELQGKHVSNNFDEMAKANLNAAITLRDSGVVAAQSTEWQEALTVAIVEEIAARKAATEAEAAHAAEMEGATTETDKSREATLKAAAAQREHERDLRKTNAAYDDLGGATADQLSAESRHFTSLAAVDAKYDDLHGSVVDVVAATNEMSAAYDALTNRFDQRQSWINLNTAIDEFKWKMNSGELSTEEQELAIISLGTEMANYVQKLEGVPDEKKTEILAIIATGDLLKAEQEIEKLTRPRTVTLGFAMPVVPKFHDGGVVPGPVGQEQLALVKGGETILPTHKGGGHAASGGGGGSGGIRND